MRNNIACPKCGLTNIVKAPDVRGSGTGANVINIPGFFSVGVVISRYICTDCGYSEEWIDKKEDLEKIRNTFE